jgi:hypothetical protein
MTLRETIEQAFSDVPYPGDTRITSHGCPECDEIAEYFRGTTWRGHSVDLLRYHSAALSLFTSEAYHYFLPAFMPATLDDAEAADLIPHSIVCDFTRPSEADLQPHFDRRLALFTPEQSRAVIGFLGYLAEIGEFREYFLQPAVDALSSHE